MDTIEQPLVSLEAADLVLGARNKDYGHPLDDFTCTAAMMTAYLRHRGLLKDEAEIDAEDIGPLMICVKLSRQANAPRRDNLIDICGYANTTQMVEEETVRRQRAELAGWDADEEEDAFSCTDEEVDRDETGRCGDDDCELCYDMDRLHQAVVNAQAAGVLSPLQRQVNEEIRAHQAAQAEKQQAFVSPRPAFLLTSDGPLPETHFSDLVRIARGDPPFGPMPAARFGELAAAKAPFVPAPVEENLRQELGLSPADIRPIPAEPEYETSDVQALFRDLIALCMLPGDLFGGR